MTDITAAHRAKEASESIAGGAAEEYARVIADLAGGHGLIEIDLVGCPSVVPRMMVSREVMTEGKLKLAFGNGYDHFEFHSFVTREENVIPVFTWAYRTKVAE